MSMQKSPSLCLDDSAGKCCLQQNNKFDNDSPHMKLFPLILLLHLGQCTLPSQHF